MGKSLLLSVENKGRKRLFNCCKLWTGKCEESITSNLVARWREMENFVFATSHGFLEAIIDAIKSLLTVE